eukprot:31399-Pelagococcus_subviridis.AAC.6
MSVDARRSLARRRPLAFRFLSEKNVDPPREPRPSPPSARAHNSTQLVVSAAAATHLMYCDNHRNPSPYPIRRTTEHMNTSIGRMFVASRFTFATSVGRRGGVERRQMELKGVEGGD